MNLEGEFTRQQTDVNLLTDQIESIIFEQSNSHKQQNNPSSIVPIILNLSRVTHCDTAGLLMLKQLSSQLEENHHPVTIDQLNQKFAPLWEAIQASTANPIKQDTPQADQKKPSKSYQQIENVGKRIHNRFGQAHNNIAAMGEILFHLVLWLKNPFKQRLRNFWYYIDDIGPGSFPLIALIGILFGLILSFQSLVQLKQFGAEVYTANLVSVSLIKELGPLLMAIVLMGRIASAYAAEISAMKVNQEIDALKAMALNPVSFLVLPRLIAAAIAAPFLTILIDLFGLLGCGLLMLSEGFGRAVIVQQMFSFVTISAIFISLFKSMVFGFLLVSIGCIQGLNSGKDATAVGKATTMTVVQCIVSLVVVDGIFSVIFYALG